MKENQKDKWEYPTFDSRNLTKWNWMCQYHENLELGINVDVGAFTYMNAKFGLIIEKNVKIGSHCSIYTNSTIDNKKGKVVIKENSRIGSHSTIMPGITIGRNALVGAHSFVNKDIPDGSIGYGVPIQIKKSVP